MDKDSLTLFKKLACLVLVYFLSNMVTVVFIIIAAIIYGFTWKTDPNNWISYKVALPHKLGVAEVLYQRISPYFVEFNRKIVVTLSNNKKYTLPDYFENGSLGYIDFYLKDTQKDPALIFKENDNVQTISLKTKETNEFYDNYNLKGAYRFDKRHFCSAE